MKFLIIGAGAVGGYIGGRLMQAGEDVTFLVRPRRREELFKNGLKIKSPIGDFVVTDVRAESDAHAISSCDVMIVAVKNYALEDVIGEIARIANIYNPLVISVLNGVEHLEKIQSVVTPNRIIGGPLYIEATLDPKGDVLHKSAIASITLGGLDKNSQVVKFLISVFEKTGFKVTSSENILAEFWKKYLFILALSSLTSLARRPIGEIRSDHWLNRTLEELVSEVVSVAHVVEPKIGPLNSDEILTRIANLPATMTSSMHQDIERGAPLEVESLQGYLIRKAEDFGLKVPVLQTCYGLLRTLETGST
jgi:2-dehydropantoate 2-reductase